MIKVLELDSVFRLARIQFFSLLNLKLTQVSIIAITN